MNKLSVLLMGLIVMSDPWGVVYAHSRDYLDTYQAYTIEKGRFEVEVWTDLRKPDHGDDYLWNQTEFEYGFTDRFMVGLYGVFVEGEGFAAMKYEGRYRLQSDLPYKSALYFEIQDANDHKEEDEFEFKYLATKVSGPWDFTANGILSYEREIESDGEVEWEFEPGLALATSRKGRRITPGIEILLKEKKSRLTPGLYIDLTKDIRLNLGVGIGLEEEADDWQVKSILEIEL